MKHHGNEYYAVRPFYSSGHTLTLPPARDSGALSQDLEPTNMPDNSNNHQEPDRINVHDRAELERWMHTLDVTEEKLTNIVQAHGSRVEDVKRALEKPDLPYGYRELNMGERVEDGDLQWNSVVNQWSRVITAEKTLVVQRQEQGWYCRKNDGNFRSP
jgi:hypothetical protein